MRLIIWSLVLFICLCNTGTLQSSPPSTSPTTSQSSSPDDSDSDLAFSVNRSSSASESSLGKLPNVDGIPKATVIIESLTRSLWRVFHWVMLGSASALCVRLDERGRKMFWLSSGGQATDLPVLCYSLETSLRVTAVTISGLTDAVRQQKQICSCLASQTWTFRAFCFLNI